jgi:hypothetical protein
MVMFNIGKGANDATCPIFGAPHMIVGSLPSSSERIFSSGNERTMTFFNPPVRLDYCIIHYMQNLLTEPGFSGPTRLTWDILSTLLIDSGSLLT